MSTGNRGFRRTNKTPGGYKNEPNGRIHMFDKVYVGFVKDNKDTLKMGRLRVWIPEISGDPEDDARWYTVNYCSPFGGASKAANGGIKRGSEDPNDTQQAYGFWAVPPDLDNEVVVMFINGDPNRGIWVGSLFQQFMNHMVPGIASDRSYQEGASGVNPPVKEYNKWGDVDSEEPIRPRFGPLHCGLYNEGLYTDPVRGPSTASARREDDYNPDADSIPSRVEGEDTSGASAPAESTDPAATSPTPVQNIAPGSSGGGRGGGGGGAFLPLKAGASTSPSNPASPARPGTSTPAAPAGNPNPGIVPTSNSTGSTAANQNQDAETASPPALVYGLITPKGNHIYIDDANDGMIRLRTRHGAQIMINDEVGYIYMITRNGNSWMELSDDGIDMYSAKSISMRAQGDINMHADGNINEYAAGSMNHVAQAGYTGSFHGGHNTLTDQLNLTSAGSVNIYSPTRVSISGPEVGIAADNNIGITAGGQIGITSSSETKIVGSKVKINQDKGPQATVEPISQTGSASSGSGSTSGGAGGGGGGAFLANPTGSSSSTSTNPLMMKVGLLAGEPTATPPNAGDATNAMSTPATTTGNNSTATPTDDSEDSCCTASGATTAGSQGSSGPSSLGNVPTDGKNNQRAMQYFMGQGWTKAQAAGIVGNLMQESSTSLNPTAKNSIGMYGIAQWDTTRRANFQKVMGKSIYGSSFDDQCKFVQWELTHSHKSAGNSLKSATTATQAAQVVQDRYEVAPGQDDGKRAGYANAMFQQPLSVPKPGDQPTQPAAPPAASDSQPAGGGSPSEPGSGPLVAPQPPEPTNSGNDISGPIEASTPKPSGFNDRELDTENQYPPCTTFTTVSRLVTHEPFDLHPTACTPAANSPLGKSSIGQNIQGTGEEAPVDDDVVVPDDGKKFATPVSGTITSIFGEARSNPRPHRHSGIDIAGGMGTPIHASKGGRVIFAGTKGGYGNCIDIDHGNGVTTRYGHLSKIFVSTGQEVNQMDKIGLMGNSGFSTGRTGVHLHFEIRFGSAADPFKYIPQVNKGGHVTAGSQTK